MTSADSTSASGKRAEHGPAIVEMRNIVKRFGNAEVLRNVSLDVRRGEVHALLGGNGAGKSTLMKILMGVYRPDGGQIVMDGEELGGAGVAASLSRGVAMIFQELSLLPNLTVAENIFFGREPLKPGFRINGRLIRRNAAQLLSEHGFKLPVDSLVVDLPFAQRQIVEIVRAASFGARVIIMDEPTSALTALEEEKLFELIRRLTARGIGIVYISHRMGEIMRIADRITILRDGHSRPPIMIADARIENISAEISGPSKAIERKEPAASRRSIGRDGEPSLRVENLSSARTLKNVSFDIHPGEIVGIAGLVGSGRSTLCKALAGLLPDASGSVKLAGRPIHLGRPHAILGNGLGFVPEDRRLEGLVLDHSLETNVALPNLSRLRSGGGLGLVMRARIRALFNDSVRDLALVARGPTQHANELSGGNQQKVVVAKWLAARPTVLILDEPTSGVDIRAKAEMANALRAAVEQYGLAILLVNSELDEMTSLCDRIFVLDRGRLVNSAPPGVTPSQLQVMLLQGPAAIPDLESAHA